MQRKFISRRSFLKCAGMGAVTAAAAGLLAGCGGSDSSSSSTASSAAAAEPADPNKPYAGVTLYYAATDTEATGPEMQDIVAMVKEKTGINIEFNIIPKADTGEVDKRLVSLQAGDALDIVYGTVAQLKVFYDAGVLEPLDELASAASYDKAQFGMFVCGGWAASMLPDTEKYPRDWQCVILPMPYPEGQEPSTLTVPGCYAVPSTSKNKEAAFEAVRCIAENQVEAAEIDGANKWQQIKNVVIPAVAPTTFFLTISSIITSLQNFTVIQSLTDGGPGQATTVMSLNIVNTAFVKYETSYAAAQALVMFAIVMVITLIQWRGQKKWADQ